MILGPTKQDKSWDDFETECYVNIWLKTKLRMYSSVVLYFLFYDSESCTLFLRHIKMLESFNVRVLRSILGKNLFNNPEIL